MTTELDENHYIQEWVNSRILDTTVTILRLGCTSFEKCVQLFNRRFYFERIILGHSADAEPSPDTTSSYDNTSTSQNSSYLMPYCAEALCSDCMSETVLCHLQKQSECYRNGAPPVAEVRVRRGASIEGAVLFAFGRAKIELSMVELFPRCDFTETLILQGILILMHVLNEEQYNGERETDPLDLPLEYTSIILRLTKDHTRHLLKLTSSAVFLDTQNDGTVTGPNQESQDNGVLDIFVCRFLQVIEHPDRSFSCESASRVLERISVWVETVEKVALPWALLWGARRPPSIDIWFSWSSFLLCELSQVSDSTVSQWCPLKSEKRLLSRYVELSNRIISWRNTKMPSSFTVQIKKSVELFYGKESSCIVMWLMHIMVLLIRYKPDSE